MSSSFCGGKDHRTHTVLATREKLEKLFILKLEAVDYEKALVNG
jgi:hypothetical protein